MTENPWTYSLYKLMWGGLDALFPPVCGGCEKPGSRWCADCQQRVPLLTGNLCDICGQRVPSTGLCDSCRAGRPAFHSLRAWCAFDEPIRNALHRLKYRRDMGLGDALASQMAGFLRGLNWPVDMMLPIPLGKKRLNERGYNQVGLVARPLAMALGLEYVPDALARPRETRSQVGLSRTERRENTRDAFAASRRLVNGKIILVMDDVSTTGSTLSSAAEALFSAGAKNVYALTVARALPHHGLTSV